jgi:uncharacterized glyoxalase superfamily protein PhnB
VVPELVYADVEQAIDWLGETLGFTELWRTDGHMQTELLDRRRWRTRMELANAIFQAPLRQRIDPVA